MEIIENYAGHCSNEIQVVVAVPFMLFCAGLQELIDGLENISATGISGNIDELKDLLDGSKPDQLLLASEISGFDNLEMVSYLADRYPDMKVILLSENQHPGYIAEAFSCGVSGYLGENACINELETAIHQVNTIGLYYNRDSITALYHNKDMEEKEPPIPEPQVNLTDVEVQVLDMVYQGCNDKQIGAAICKSDRTVQGYKRKLMAKFGVNKTSMVMFKAIEAGWLINSRRDLA